MSCIMVFLTKQMQRPLAFPHFCSLHGLFRTHSSSYCHRRHNLMKLVVMTRSSSSVYWLFRNKFEYLITVLFTIFANNIVFFFVAPNNFQVHCVHNEYARHIHNLLKSTMICMHMPVVLSSSYLCCLFFNFVESMIQIDQIEWIV